MNKDRGMIKWMPFNSLMNGRVIVNNLLDEKSKRLSEYEQMKQDIIKKVKSQISQHRK